MNEGNLRILMLEDVPADAELVQHALERDHLDFSAVVVARRSAFIDQLESFAPDVILADYSLVDFTGDEALLLAKQRLPEVPFVFVSGVLGEDKAVELVKQGADDYVVKDRMARLGTVVRRAVATAAEAAERKAAEERFQAVVAALVDPLATLRPVRDATGDIVDFECVYANTAMQDLLALQKDELIGKRLLEVVPPEFTVALDVFKAIVDSGELLEQSGMYEGVLGRRGEVSLSFDFRAVPLGDGVAFSVRDVTARKVAEAALVQSESRFRSLIQGSNDVIFVLDAAARLQFASPAARSVLGYEPDALQGRSMLDLVHPEDLPGFAGAFAKMAARPGLAPRTSYRVQHGDGHFRWVESIGNNLLDDPSVGGIVINARDITSRKQAEQVVSDEREVLELIARDTPVQATLERLIHVVESEYPGAICEIAVRCQGRTPLHTTCATALPPDYLRGVEILQSRGCETPQQTAIRTGETVIGAVEPTEERWTEWRELARASGLAGIWAMPIFLSAPGGGTISLYQAPPRAPSPAELGLLRAASNIAALAVERHIAAQELAHQALHDELTGLPNRILLADRLAGALSSGRRNGTETAVLLLDIDHFKVVNDSLGHSFGDGILRETAQRLGAAVRPGDTVARFGGDEFVVVCPSLRGAGDSGRVARRLLGSFAAPFEVSGGNRFLTASVGIAMSSNNGSDEEGLLRDADAAMYRAKELGRNRVEVFGTEMRRDVLARLQIDDELRGAIARDEMTVYYQPQVHLTSGLPVGVEALVRWEHPTKGLVLPNEFVPVAEDTGLIVALGSWVLERACADAVGWKTDGHPMRISVNLSARQLSEPGLVESVARVLEATGLPPERLCLEVTENILIEEAASLLQTLYSLRALGVWLSIDDFGTGYASLTYLKRLPVHELKVDMSFVQGLGRNTEDDAIVTAITSLALSLGLGVVAEGVETDLQAERLVSMGCLTAQGFRFLPALPAHELTSWFERRLLAGHGATR